ncbi:WDR63 protein, partial [Alcedo cyanopectus]|nr:WDR63 protein [Ceyx cyanopectus]
LGHPEIFPLVFTTKTQEIFNCRVHEDVTEENCFKLIKKEDIIQDLKARAAISDFHPVKKVVLDYPGEELLVVFDAKFQYGQNFYLVASEEAKENMLKPPETEEEEKEEEENSEETLEVQPYEPPVHKPWVSLGSEKEVEEESVKEAVPKIKRMISRAQGTFGAPITFTDRNASHVEDSYIECSSYKDETFCIKMLEKDVGIQVFPKLREASTQTKRSSQKNATMQFPRQLSSKEKEESLSSMKLKAFLKSAHLRMEIALQQNEIMNAFFDDWKALGEDESSSFDKPNVYLQEYQSFRYLHYLKNRTISCICWHPVFYGIVAVSEKERLYEEQDKLTDRSLLQKPVIFFWSIFDPIHPQLILECPEYIYCFQFSPSDPNIIAGGCINGQVALWNISQHEEKLKNAKTVADGIEVTAVNMVNASVLNVLRYIYMSPSLTQVQQTSTEPPLERYSAISAIQYGHKKTVIGIHWLPNYFEDNLTEDASENRAEICVQLVTCSTDGSALFWDVPVTKLPQDSSEKTEEKDVFRMPSDVPHTSKYLSLWKPLIKINLCESDSNTEYSLVRISLKDQIYHFKTSEKSLDILQLLTKDSPYTEISSSKTLSVLKNISTDFFVGTHVSENNRLLTKTQVEDIQKNEQLNNRKYTFHTESVNTLQRSPFFKDIILSIGSHNFAIWKEGVTNGPILQSSCSTKRNTAGHWSLARPGVFFIGRNDGNIDIWDLVKKTYEPVHVQNISNSMITFISPWIASSKQHFLAVSDDLGVLHVLEICETLNYPLRNE